MVYAMGFDFPAFRVDNEQRLEWFGHLTEYLYRALGPGADIVFEEAEKYANERMGGGQ